MERGGTGIGAAQKVKRDFSTALRVWAKDKLVRSPFKHRFLPRYSYYFHAAQLCFLCEALARTRNVAGCVLEVGVASGETTLFLNNYLDAVKIDKEYVALDTFAGFVRADVDFEVTQRGKIAAPYLGVNGLQVNQKSWFDATMQLNGVTRVRAIQADVNDFDFRSMGAVAFCLLDVDLYRPMQKALGQVYEQLSVGGMIVVDDCSSADARFDGALQAYQEFMRALGKSEQIVFEKLGVVTK